MTLSNLNHNYDEGSYHGDLYELLKRRENDGLQFTGIHGDEGGINGDPAIGYGFDLSTCRHSGNTEEIQMAHPGAPTVSWRGQSAAWRQCSPALSLIGRYIIDVTVSTLALLVIAIGGWSSSAGTAHADEAASTTVLPQLAPGAKVNDFYELVSSKDAAICRPFLSAANVGKTYDVHDERDVTLGTPFNLTWDISIPDDDWTVPPTGNWKNHQVSYREFSEGDGWQETLAVDLDNDGHTDQVYRWTRKFHSQNHSVLILLDRPATTKSDLQFLGGYQDEHGSRQLRRIENDVLTVETARRLMPGVADFYLMDVARIGGRNFVLAASMLRAPTRPVDTYVIQLHAGRRLEIICHLQSRYLIR